MSAQFHSVSPEIRQFIAEHELKLNVGRTHYTSDVALRLADSLLAEDLPLRVQVASTFNEVALGVRCQDLAVLRNLAALSGNGAADVADARKVWADSGAVRAAIDREWLLFSLDSPADPEHMRGALNALQSVVYLAALAVVKPGGADELRSDPAVVRLATQLEQGVLPLAVFYEPGEGDCDELDDPEFGEGSEDQQLDFALPDLPAEAPIAADNLKGFPLGGERFKGLFIDMMPTLVSTDGRQARTFAALNCPTYSLAGGEQVVITFEGDATLASLEIKAPPGRTFSTVADLAIADQVRIVDLSPSGAVDTEVVPAVIRVDATSIAIELQRAGQICSVTIRAPICGDCKTVEWKFESLPTEFDGIGDELKEAFCSDGEVGPFGLRWYWRASNEDIACCEGCFNTRLRKYLEENPYANFETAAAHAERFIEGEANRPDLITFFDPEAYVRRDQNDGWDFFLRREFTRGGLTVFRNVARLTIFDSGDTLLRCMPSSAMEFGIS